MRKKKKKKSKKSEFGAYVVTNVGDYSNLLINQYFEIYFASSSSVHSISNFFSNGTVLSRRRVTVIDTTTRSIPIPYYSSSSSSSLRSIIYRCSYVMDTSIQSTTSSTKHNLEQVNKFENKGDEQEYDSKSLLAELLAISKQNASNSRFRPNTSSSKSSNVRSTVNDMNSNEHQNNFERMAETDPIKSMNNNNDNDDAGKIFVEQYAENAEMNQYWYSPATIQTLCDAMVEMASHHHHSRSGSNTSSSSCSSGSIGSGSDSSSPITDLFKIAFLSTPSLYFALPINIRQHCNVFDVSSECIIILLF